MYKIIVTDFQNNLQIPDKNNYIYLTEAREACRIAAIDYILKFQGSSYLKKIFWDKNYIKKGYALTLKETPIYTKINVYFKEPNGLLYSGNLKKIRSYITMKTAGENNDFFINYNPDFNFVEQFNQCLEQIEKLHDE
jgi:hypothetical protein